MHKPRIRHWLDPLGGLHISCSQATRENWPLAEQEFSPPDVIQSARNASGPVFEVGVAVEPTKPNFNAGVITAEPVHTANRQLVGIVAASLSLVDLSEPLTAVVNAQQQRGRHLLISIIDDRGELIATPDHKRISWTVLNELPGGDQALHGHTTSQLGPGSDGQDWLFSAVPVSTFGWAVVVQRPANEALAVVTQLHLWLLTAALLFAIGGLLFWLMLLVRVIRPLHILAIQHQTLPTSEQSIPVEARNFQEAFDAKSFEYVKLRSICLPCTAPGRSAAPRLTRTGDLHRALSHPG
jgi:hypothetical protein